MLQGTKLVELHREPGWWCSRCMILDINVVCMQWPQALLLTRVEMMDRSSRRHACRTAYIFMCSLLCATYYAKFAIASASRLQQLFTALRMSSQAGHIHTAGSGCMHSLE
jgi:hypothetical protein